MNNLFDAKLSEKLKKDGMEKAADNVDETLTLARNIARRLAQKNGKVNADDVGRILKTDLRIDSLGPAAGSLFRGKEWEFTGKWVKSKRITNHSRMIREWKLKEESNNG